MRRQEINTQQKVVPLKLDAGFYFERAVKAMDRRNYDKALTYFRLAMEKEPENPVNHYNLAGLLSELGYFEESNEILEHVMHYIAPDLYECLYYMANNAANMEDFVEAEDYLLEYLSKDPEGEYVQEAEEMLFMVAAELGRTPKEPIPTSLSVEQQRHEEARWHFSEGRYLQAIELLEELLKEQPDYVAARNNMALAYFYTDQADKAVENTKKVLEQDEANLHATCNLVLFYHQMGQKQEIRSMIPFMKKMIPYKEEDLYKLAHTMGMIGEHETAFQLFTRLLRLLEPDAYLYHYTAVAAINTHRIQQAIQFWKKAAKLDPESEVPYFYLEHQSLWQQADIPPIGYYYRLPHEEPLLKIQQGKPLEEAVLEMEGSPLFRASMIWSFQHGDQMSQLQLVPLIRWMKDAEMEQMAQRYMKQMYDDHPVAFQDDLEPLRKQKYKWKQVLDCCLENMSGYNKKQQEDAKNLWLYYGKQSFKNHSIRKVEAWAATLEYAIIRHYHLSYTQSQIADKYGVSPASISRNVKSLLPHLEVLHSQYHI